MNQKALMEADLNLQISREREKSVSDKPASHNC